MIYPGNWRFLQQEDVLRKDITNFPSKLKDISPPPKVKTTAYVHKANNKYLKAKTSQAKKKQLCKYVLIIKIVCADIM